jgi:hypothetical protein
LGLVIRYVGMMLEEVLFGDLRHSVEDVNVGVVGEGEWEWDDMDVRFDFDCGL